MLDSIIGDIAAHGPWGIAVAVLLVGNIAQWRRGAKVQDDYFEQSVHTTSVLVELNVLIRDRIGK